MVPTGAGPLQTAGTTPWPWRWRWRWPSDARARVGVPVVAVCVCAAVCAWRQLCRAGPGVAAESTPGLSGPPGHLDAALAVLRRWLAGDPATSVRRPGHETDGHATVAGAGVQAGEHGGSGGGGDVLEGWNVPYMAFADEAKGLPTWVVEDPRAGSAACNTYLNMHIDVRKVSVANGRAPGKACAQPGPTELTDSLGTPLHSAGLNGADQGGAGGGREHRAAREHSVPRPWRGQMRALSVTTYGRDGLELAAMPTLLASADFYRDAVVTGAYYREVEASKESSAKQSLQPYTRACGLCFLDFVGFATRSRAPHAGPRCSCGEANEIELAATNAALDGSR